MNRLRSRRIRVGLSHIAALALLTACGGETAPQYLLSPDPPTVVIPTESNVSGDDVEVTALAEAPPEVIAVRYVPISGIYDITVTDPATGQPATDPIFEPTPAEIRFTYDRDALRDAGFTEDFAVWYRDEAGGWQVVDGITVDTDAGTVTAQTRHFTPFLLTAAPEFLWAAFSLGDSIFVRETAKTEEAIFRDTWSGTLHTLHTGAGPVSRPAVTTLHDSQWVAWEEGGAIQVKAAWWGPGNVRNVYTGAGPLTAPAIISFDGKLVVVWGEGSSLLLSTSTYGVEWTAPVEKSFAGANVSAPTIATHGGVMFVGAAFGPKLYTIRINADFTWGPNFEAAMPAAPPTTPEVTLASNGSQLSMGYVSDQQLFVLHSANGSNGWSAPILIDEGSIWGAPPGLTYYGDYLYAIISTQVRLLIKRSVDGVDWVTPRFVVEPAAPGRVAAALIGSRYNLAPPAPAVAVLNDSGIPTAGTLNIVFFSDGYVQTDIPRFQALAGRVADTFRIVNPFSRNLDKLNIYRVDLPSRQRGVDASPALAAAVQDGIWDGSGYQAAIPGFEPRCTDTGLGAHYRGCWEAPHYNPDITQTRSSPNNTNTPVCDAAEESTQPHTRLTSQKAIHIFGYYGYDLVEALVPGFDRSRDVLYVIFDQLPEDGGTDKASYNPIVSTPDFAEGFGNVHEMGHFMTSLADEDFSSCFGGIATDCGTSPNKTVNDDLSDPAHKWAHHLISEGRPGDSILADPVVRPPTFANFWDPALVNASGIFNAGLWATNGVSDWSGTGGTIVYGPSPQCLMNHTGGNSRFCPVCTEEFVEELHAGAGIVFSDADYHGVYDHVYLEFEFRRAVDPAFPKAGLLSLNGAPVAEAQFFCREVGGPEICSVDVTPQAVDGLNDLRVLPQPGVARGFNLLSLQVVNSNGAPLPIFPITDLSGVGSQGYFSSYFWNMASGELQFEFTADVP